MKILLLSLFFAFPVFAQSASPSVKALQDMFRNSLIVGVELLPPKLTCVQMIASDGDTAALWWNADVQQFGDVANLKISLDLTKIAAEDAGEMAEDMILNVALVKTKNGLAGTISSLEMGDEANVVFRKYGKGFIGEVSIQDEDGQPSQQSTGSRAESIRSLVNPEAEVMDYVYCTKAVAAQPSKKPAKAAPHHKR